MFRSGHAKKLGTQFFPIAVVCCAKNDFERCIKARKVKMMYILKLILQASFLVVPFVTLAEVALTDETNPQDLKSGPRFKSITHCSRVLLDTTVNNTLQEAGARECVNFSDQFARKANLQQCLNVAKRVEHDTNIKLELIQICKTKFSIKSDEKTTRNKIKKTESNR